MKRFSFLVAFLFFWIGMSRAQDCSTLEFTIAHATDPLNISCSTGGG